MFADGLLSEKKGLAEFELPVLVLAEGFTLLVLVMFEADVAASMPFVVTFFRIVATIYNTRALSFDIQKQLLGSNNDGLVIFVSSLSMKQCYGIE